MSISDVPGNSSNAWWLLLRPETTREDAEEIFFQSIGREAEEYKGYPSGVLVGPLTDEEGKEVEKKRRGG
ncbi:MAG TPA: hypothetical protein VMW24_24990 [Sedimentisphaerales bacterium]|nr:hypothetical protein [Sedimentisphaerales bacterium]